MIKFCKILIIMSGTVNIHVCLILLFLSTKISAQQGLYEDCTHESNCGSWRISVFVPVKKYTRTHTLPIF